MAFSTARVVLQASASNAAGATATGAGWVDISGRGGGLVSAKVVNGATGPSAGCAFFLDVSPDGTDVYESFGYGLADVANNGVYPFHVHVPFGTRFIRSRFTGNTGQAVTVQADFMAAATV